MKKIVGMGAAVALAASMFAAEPAANAAVTEFTGNASVEWGVDLDSKKTGFKNSTDAQLKFKLFDGGSKSTEGSGIWAELKIKSDDDGNPAWKAENGTPTIKGAVIDTAKIHINNFYVGIQKGDTETGEFKPQAAIVSDKAWLGNVGPADFTQGLVFGYDDSNINAGVDFRSFEHTSTQYTNAYAIAAEATMKDANEWVEGLEVKGGVSYNLSKNYYEKADNNLAVKKFALKYDTNDDGVDDSVEGSILGYSGSVAYKVALDDKYYIKPMAGITGDVLSAELGTVDCSASANQFVASVLFGWGAQADANAGVPFLDGDDAKKVTPGVSVSYEKDLESDANYGEIEAAFYLGKLVENLKAAALFSTTLVKEVNDTPIKVLAGCAYDVKADEITITPKAGVLFANKAAGDEIKVKAGVDVAGLISNTTFYAVYASNNLKADENKIGTLNVGCKIAF